MRATLLIVDGSPHASGLVRMLERDGFSCHQARGPLRVRALLQEQPIDLIVWTEEGGNRDLARDLLAEWARHPQIPVLHLFSREGTSALSGHHPQVRESLPYESAANGLTPLITRLLERGQPEPQPVRRTELAFRHIVQHLRERRGTGQTEEGWPQQADLRAPVTSVNVAERERLSGPLPRKPFRLSLGRWLPRRWRRR